MNKRGIMGLIVIVGILVAGGFFWFVGEKVGDGANLTEEKCVSATCCHAKDCVPENEAPNCSETFCTMECRGGTMDCGAGHCAVIDGECGVVWDE